ncbi:MAG: cyclopropane-fatty-acyl-phospholipid synthase family protein [Candidatus Obscuribacterales bacterium]|nr:cyclopropane-fatty-acyl-phospholipid synthase family protein [Candidatus Obscuribacterales bacterium]
MQTKIASRQSAAKVSIESKFPQVLNKLASEKIFALLSQMKVGAIEMELPDGTCKRFGAAEGAPVSKLQVLNPDFFTRCLLYADLGLAESYLDGLCLIDDIRGLITWFLDNNEQSPVLNESENLSRILNLLGLVNKLLHRTRRNSELKSKSNISEHYDLGNEFFKSFLDCSLTYSSALFTHAAENLFDAQINKFDRICKQLRLKEGERLLEIGSGWGGFSVYAAKNYGTHITAITISEEQYSYMAELIKREKLQNLIELQLKDYRKLEGKFDKIVSIEMIEAVGEEYIDEYIAKIDSLLKPHGIVLLQLISCPDSRYETLAKNVDFIQKHIFPGSLLQSQHRVNMAMRKSGDLFPVDLFDLTESYVRTLEIWQENFNNNWSQIEKLGFDERFRRKWNYYFEYCQAAFYSRNISALQLTYSRPNNKSLNRSFK